MSPPASFKLKENFDKLIVERFEPSKNHLRVQGFVSLGIVAFFVLGYLLSQLELNTFLKIGIVLFPPSIYVGLSLICAPWCTKETIIIDKNSGLLTYRKQGKHPWLLINKRGKIFSLPPFLIEYFYFPLEEITSIHSMTLDSVDEFQDFLVFYFCKIDTYMAMFEYGADSTKIGHKLVENISQFLGKSSGKEINKPPMISFNLSFVNDLIRSVTKRKNEGIKINTRDIIWQYEYKLIISATLTHEKNNQTIQENPNDAHAHLMLGLYYLGQKAKKVAIGYLEIAYNLFCVQRDTIHSKRVQKYLKAISET